MQDKSFVTVLTNQRSPWIDNFRFLAILLVLFGHATHPFPHAPYVHESYAAIRTFNKHLFFYISGYVSWRRPEKINNCNSLFKNWWSNILRILIPGLIPSFFICFFDYLILDVDYSFTWYYWFLSAMFCIQSLFSLSCWLSKYIGRIFSYVFFVFIVSLTTFVWQYGICLSAEFALIFLFGFFDKKYDIVQQIMNFFPRKYIYVALSIIFLLTYQLSLKVEFYNHSLFDYIPYSLMWMFLRYIPALSILIVLSDIMQRYFSRKYTFFTSLGAKTIGIYTISVLIQECSVHSGLVYNEDTCIATLFMFLFFLLYSLLTFVSVTFFPKSQIMGALFLGRKA